MMLYYTDNLYLIVLINNFSKILTKINKKSLAVSFFRFTFAL